MAGAPHPMVAPEFLNSKKRWAKKKSSPGSSAEASLLAAGAPAIAGKIREEADEFARALESAGDDTEKRRVAERDKYGLLTPLATLGRQSAPKKR